MTTRPKTRKRSRFKACCLLSLSSIVLLIVAVIGLAALYYNKPLSHPKLHDRVARRLERLSGLAISYDTASLNIATGRYHIRNLRFTDPARPKAPELTVEDVYATIQPWEILLQRESRISAVTLKKPSALDFVYSQNSIRPGRKTRFLLDAIKNAQPPDSDHHHLPFDNLKIQDAEITFTESEGILPDITPPKEAFRLVGTIDVENQPHPQDSVAIRFHGCAIDPEYTTTSVATVCSDLQLALQFDSETSMTISGKARELALHELFRDNPQSYLKADDLKFDVATTNTADQRWLNGHITMAAMDVSDPTSNVHVRDENLHFESSLVLDTSGTLQMDRVALVSNGATLQVSGEIAPQPDDTKSYRLSIAGRNLDEDYRTLLERALPAGWDFDSEPDRLAFHMDVAATDKDIQHLVGEVQLRGVKVASPVLPVPLLNLSGDVHFSRKDIKFNDVTADYGGARVALDGQFEGDPWGTRSGELGLHWSAIVDVEKLLKLHGKQIAPGQALTASGKITGNGTWAQAVDLKSTEQVEIPRIEGGFNFENVSLKHPSLPAPLSNLNGKAVIDGNRLSVKNLSGQARGNQMTIDGTMQGKRYFWRDPQLSATLTSVLDLEHLADYLPQETREQVAAYGLRGKTETRMALSGPVGDLGSHLTGVMQLNGVCFSPQLEFMNGDINDVTGVVRWDGKSLSLDNLQGKLGKEDVNLSGKITAAHVDLRVKTPATLDAIGKMFPELSQNLDMAGAMKTDLRFTAGTAADAKAAPLNQVLEQARELIDRSVKEQRFALNGQFELNNATMRHHAMPPARKEGGRTIPTGEVTGMTGTVHIKDDILSVSDDQPLRCAFADSPDCRLSGRIKLRPDNLPQMSVRINTRGTLRLDTWIAGWGKELPVPDRPPMTGKVFELDADIQAAQVLLRGQRGGRSRGKLSFRLVQNETPRVTQFHEVVVQGAVPGTGRVIGSGRIESYVWNPRNFPRWQTSVDLQAMPLETMLSAVFVEPTNIRGLTNGHINVQGVGDNPLSIQGGGSAYVRNLELGGTAVIRQLGQTTGRDLGGRLFESAQAATFDISRGTLSSRDLNLQTNGLQLEMRGRYWFAGDPDQRVAARTIDGTMRMRLFKSVFGSIPIIGQVADLADEVTNAFLLAFRVTGTADNPHVTPLPLPLFQGA